MQRELCINSWKTDENKLGNNGARREKIDILTLDQRATNNKGP
jgi:hypothetical protein